MHSPNKQLRNKNCIDNKLFEVLNSKIPFKECLVLVIYFIVIYSFTVFTLTVISLTVWSGNCYFEFDYIRPLSHNQPSVAVANTKVFYLILLSFAIRRSNTLSGLTSIYELASTFFVTVAKVDKSYGENNESISTPTRLYEYFTCCTSKVWNSIRLITLAMIYSILLLNFLLIAIVIQVYLILDQETN